MPTAFDRENRKYFRDLARLLRRESHSVIGLLGAGASAAEPDNYPLWPKLVGMMHEETARHLQRKTARRALGLYSFVKDAPIRAELYRQALPPRIYHQFLEKTFVSRGKTRVSPLAARIAKLNVAHYITTNYEDVMARAGEQVKRPVTCIDWQDPGAMQDFFFDLNRTGAPRRCVYLHGQATRPEGIILTEADYVRQYVRSEETKRKLFVLFSTKRMLFIGFSLSDPDLMFLQREAWATINYSEARHYAILGWSPAHWKDDHPSAVALHFRTKFGILPIFYPVSEDGSHQALNTVLDCLQANDASKLPEVGQEPSREQEAPVTEFTARSHRDAEDPEKGMWGRRSEIPGRRLKATVQAISEEWFAVKLVLEATPGAPPLSGTVKFHLHPSFYPAVREVTPSARRAVLELEAWGAFTFGVEADNGQTRLELDLADAAVGAPALFRSR